MKEYLFNVLEIISQGLNTVFFNGNPNMTVSARCYLSRDKPYWGQAYKVLNKVFFWQDDHCMESWVSDIRFARKALFELGAPKSKPIE